MFMLKYLGPKVGAFGESQGFRSERLGSPSEIVLSGFLAACTQSGARVPSELVADCGPQIKKGFTSWPQNPNRQVERHFGGSPKTCAAESLVGTALILGTCLHP